MVAGSDDFEEQAPRLSSLNFPSHEPDALRWRNAKEDFLGTVFCARIDCRPGSAFVVGACRHDSDRRGELVGGVSERLVLIDEIS